MTLGIPDDELPMQQREAEESNLTDVETELRKMIPHLLKPAPDAAKILALAADIVHNSGHAIHALKIKAQANEEAAVRAPQCADWSNGVAAGMRTAIELLTLGPEETRQSPA